MLNFSPLKTVMIALLLLTGAIVALPNLLSQQALDSLPDWFPKKKIVLGLDLQGGSHLLLEVDVKALIAERLGAVVGRYPQQIAGEKYWLSGPGR